MTATLPDQIQLEEGEEFDFHAISHKGTLIVTRVTRSAPTPAATDKRKPSFAAKWGNSMPQLNDPTDAVLTHINQKHVK